MQCPLELTDTGTLRTPPTVPGIILNSRVLRLDSGSYVAAPLGEPGTLGVFDDRGAFLRIIGGRGQGPGEFESIDVIVASGGETLLVADHRLSRLSRITTRGRIVDILRLPARTFDIAALSDGRIAAQMNIPTEQKIALPVHILDRKGRILDSFGSMNGMFQDWNADVHARYLAASPSGIWVMRTNEYKFELWNLNGELETTLTRDTEWFHPWDLMSRTSYFESPPDTRSMGLQATRDGLIWFLFIAADSNWKRRPAINKPPGQFTLEDLRPVLDWIIEVVDSKQRRVVASHRFDGFVQLAAPGVIARAAEEPSGAVRFDLLSARPPAP